MADLSDQRKYPRVDLDLPVFVVGREMRARARMINLSLGGCQVKGPLQTRPGEVLAILCGAKRADRGFRAKVVWAVPGEGDMCFGGSFLAGEEERRELVKSLIRLGRPDDAREEMLRIG